MKILMLLKSSLDNDSRVLKEIESLASVGYEISLVSVNSKTNSIVNRHLIVSHKAKRRIVPGISSLIFNYNFIKAAFNEYSDQSIIHCHDFNTLFTGVLIIKLIRKKIKLLYDSHEFAINDTPNQGKLSIIFNKLIEGMLIKYADGVINVSESISKEYARIYKIKKPVVLLNCPKYSEEPKGNLFRQKFNITEDQVIFLYQGGLGRGRGIEMLLNAFASLKSEQCVLIIMGSGELENIVKDKVRNSKNIIYHSAVSPKVLPEYTSSADYGILSYEDNCLNHKYCSPNKMFEYLMAGIPVLTTNLVEMKRLVDLEGIGAVTKENNAEEMKRAIKYLLNQNYKSLINNVMNARKKYCWEVQEILLFKLYFELSEK